MKKVLALALLLPLMFTTGFEANAETDPTDTNEDEVVEETETDETVPSEDMTEEELKALIDESLGLALSLWDKIIAFAGVSSVGGMLILFVSVNKKFKLFGDDSGKVNDNITALKTTVDALTKEERDMKRAMIAMLEVANVDSYTKGELKKLLENDELSHVDFMKVAAQIAEHKEENKDTDESDSILEELSKK